VRTVGAKLVLEAASYIKDARTAGAATGDLADQIGKARDESVSATAATDRLGRAVNYVAGNAKQAARDVGKATGETTHFGVSASVAARHVDQLGDEIKNVERELLVMAAAFAAAGSKAERLDISKAIRRTEADLKRLNKSKGLLSGVLPATSWVAKLRTGVTTALESSGPLLPAVAILGTALLPTVGATIAAAVIGGVGIGGVAGGLMLAAKNPGVQAAFKETADGLKQELTEASSSFVEPAIAAVRTLGRAVHAVDFKSIFADASRFVGPLTAGVAAFVSGVSDGIRDLVRAAGPVIRVISSELGELGGIIGKGFSDLAKHGDTAAHALNAVLDSVNAIIADTFYLIDGLTTVYGWLEKIGSVTGFTYLDLAMRDATGLATGAGSAMADLVKKELGVGDAATTAANGLQSLNEHLNDVTGSARTLFGAATDVGGAIDDVTAAAKKNGKTLDENTPKGRANRDAIAGLARALQAQYDASVDVNGIGPKSDAVAAQNRASFIRLATSLTGSSRQARILADQILGIPTKHDTKIHADPEPAITAARRAQAAINAVHGKTITVNIRVTGGGALNKAVSGHLGVRGEAAGGPIAGPGPKGRDSELRMLAPGEHVWTAREVDAAGGHGAVMRLRSSALSSPQRMAGGGPVPTQSTRVMPATASSVTTVVYEHRVTFADTQNEIGQLLVKAIRTSPGVRAEMAERLGVKKAG
jgi:hypothetical protein